MGGMTKCSSRRADVFNRLSGTERHMVEVQANPSFWKNEKGMDYSCDQCVLGHVRMPSHLGSAFMDTEFVRSASASQGHPGLRR